MKKTIPSITIAAVIEGTLAVVNEAGIFGVTISELRDLYAQLKVPPALADLVERKLVEDGMVTVSNDRIYFTCNRSNYLRLTQTRV